MFLKDEMSLGAIYIPDGRIRGMDSGCDCQDASESHFMAILSTQNNAIPYKQIQCRLNFKIE